jgi:hypothetical protein
VRVLAVCFLQLRAENLRKVCTFAPLFFLIWLTCTPILIDGSTIFGKTTTVTHVVALVWPIVLLAYHTVLVSPAHLLGFLGDAGVHRLHLVLPISPFHLSCTGQLGIKLGIVLDVLEYQ